MQELDSGEGLGPQGPQILHEVIPLLSCQLPSNCLWQMVALRACQSLPQLKIRSDDNGSILKDTTYSQCLRLHARDCAVPGLSGLLILPDRVERSI